MDNSTDMSENKSLRVLSGSHSCQTFVTVLGYVSRRVSDEFDDAVIASGFVFESAVMSRCGCRSHIERVRKESSSKGFVTNEF
jgi:hypothetical protein